MKNKSVYILEAIQPRVAVDGKKGHYEKDEDENVKCWRERIGIFSSVKLAERAMHQFIDAHEHMYVEWKMWERHFGFMLEEVRLDDEIDEFDNFGDFESVRSYLADGTLNCFSDYDSRCKKKFTGRDEPQRFVKSGEYAWLYQGDHLTPILIDKLSITKDEWTKHFKPGVAGDFTDDSGVSFTSEYHIHPFAVNVFPFSALKFAKLTKKLKTKMNKAKKEYYSES